MRSTRSTCIGRSSRLIIVLLIMAFVIAGGLLLRSTFRRWRSSHRLKATRALATLILGRMCDVVTFCDVCDVRIVRLVF